VVVVVGAGVDGGLGLAAGAELAGALLEEAGGVEVELGLELD
jgi:hypothetical protein